MTAQKHKALGERLMEQPGNRCTLTFSTITPAHARAFLGSLPLWFESLAAAAELHQPAFEMAHELGHPDYDCLYLAPAEREQSRVVTAERTFAERVAGSRWGSLIEHLSHGGGGA